MPKAHYRHRYRYHLIAGNWPKFASKLVTSMQNCDILIRTRTASHPSWHIRWLIKFLIMSFKHRRTYALLATSTMRKGCALFCFQECIWKSSIYFFFERSLLKRSFHVHKYGALVAWAIRPWSMCKCELNLEMSDFFRYDRSHFLFHRP